MLSTLVLEPQYMVLGGQGRSLGSSRIPLPSPSLQMNQISQIHTCSLLFVPEKATNFATLSGISYCKFWNLEIHSHPPMHIKKNQNKGLPMPPFPSWLNLLSLFSNRARANVFMHRTEEESLPGQLPTTFSWIKMPCSKCSSMSYFFMGNHEETRFLHQKKWGNTFIFAGTLFKIIF